MLLAEVGRHQCVRLGGIARLCHQRANTMMVPVHCGQQLLLNFQGVRHLEQQLNGFDQG